MNDQPPDSEITSDVQFETALGRLLAEAVHNDVDPSGNWEYRNCHAMCSDWEIQVWELQQTHASED